jgi:fission 1 protein
LLRQAKLLKHFVSSNIIEIYTDAPERRRECLYFLAIGNFKISNYSEARRFNDQLLKLEPRNDQALALKQLVDEKVSTGKYSFLEYEQ